AAPAPDRSAANPGGAPWSASAVPGPSWNAAPGCAACRGISPSARIWVESRGEGRVMANTPRGWRGAPGRPLVPGRGGLGLGQHGLRKRKLEHDVALLVGDDQRGREQVRVVALFCQQF